MCGPCLGLLDTEMQKVLYLMGGSLFDPNVDELSPQSRGHTTYQSHSVGTWQMSDCRPGILAMTQQITPFSCHLSAAYWPHPSPEEQQKHILIISLIAYKQGGKKLTSQNREQVKRRRFLNKILGSELNPQTWGNSAQRGKAGQALCFWVHATFQVSGKFPSHCPLFSQASWQRYNLAWQAACQRHISESFIVLFPPPPPKALSQSWDSGPIHPLPPTPYRQRE